MPHRRLGEGLPDLLEQLDSLGEGVASVDDDAVSKVSLGDVAIVPLVVPVKLRANVRS